MNIFCRKKKNPCWDYGLDADAAPHWYEWAIVIGALWAHFLISKVKAWLRRLRMAIRA
jgi:hypothetical protein